MSLTITLTGTGGAQLVPVFGCDCVACTRARQQPQHRRQPCCGVVQFNDAVTLLDAGLADMMERFPAGQCQQVLLMHSHIDNVQRLFPLCLGDGASNPVSGPSDKKCCYVLV